MTQESPQYGPALYRIAEQEWTRLGLTRDAWSRQLGIPASTMLRWSNGVTPSFEMIRRVVETTGRPMLETLIDMGVLTKAEAGQELAPPSIDAVIRTDATMSTAERDILLNVRAAFRRGVNDGDTIAMRVPVRDEPVTKKTRSRVAKRP